MSDPEVIEPHTSQVASYRWNLVDGSGPSTPCSLLRFQSQTRREFSHLSAGFRTFQILQFQTLQPMVAAFRHRRNRRPRIPGLTAACEVLGST